MTAAVDWKSRHPFRSGQIVVARLDIALVPASAGMTRVLACGSAVVVHGIGCDTSGNWISVHEYPGQYFHASDFSAAPPSDDGESSPAGAPHPAPVGPASPPGGEVKVEEVAA